MTRLEFANQLRQHHRDAVGMRFCQASGRKEDRTLPDRPHRLRIGGVRVDLNGDGRFLIVGMPAKEVPEAHDVHKVYFAPSHRYTRDQI